MKKLLLVIYMGTLIVWLSSCSKPIKYDYRPFPYVGSEYFASISEVTLNKSTIEKVKSLEKSVNVYTIRFIPSNEINMLFKNTSLDNNLSSGKNIHFIDSMDSKAEIRDKLSDDEYIKKSLKYLGEKNLDFENLDLQPKVYEKLFMHTLAADADINPQIAKSDLFQIGVVFYHEPIDGITLAGTVPYIDIAFDEENHVTAVTGIWFEVQPSGKQDLVQIEEAISRMKRNDMRLFTSEGIEEKDILNVEGVEVVYYCNADMADGDVLLPHYRFIGKNRSGKHAETIVCAVAVNNLNFVTYDTDPGDEKPSMLQEKAAKLPSPSPIPDFSSVPVSSSVPE